MNFNREAYQRPTTRTFGQLLIDFDPKTSSREKRAREEKTSEEVKVPETRENIQKRVLRSTTMLNPHQTEKSKSILKELQSSSDVSINDDGLIEIDKTPTACDASNFLFTLQKLYHPDYKRILDKTKTSPYLVPNSKTKEIVKPKETPQKR